MYSFIQSVKNLEHKYAYIICIVVLSLLLVNNCVYASDNFSFEIHIPYKVGADVTVVTDRNMLYKIGTVTRLPNKTRYPSYTASAWGKESCICASAVNAVHILVSKEQNKGRTLSIIPENTIAPAAGTNAAFVLSTKAGHGPFGLWAPYVGASVFVSKSCTGETVPLSANFKFENGDILIIRSTKAKSNSKPYMVDFENHPGGRIIIYDNHGFHTGGRVLKPVLGTGRFGGTKFQDVSRLRANHCGVIDLSTSPVGKIGGFQIIPIEHSITSKEMQSVWWLTQWMIVMNNSDESGIKATYPLFKGALIPGGASDEKTNDTIFTYGRKSLALVRINGGEWQKIPEIIGKNDYALKDVTHIRIYMPFDQL